MRNAVAHAGKTQRRVVSAFVHTAFAQDEEAAAKTQWRQVADQLRPRVPKLANLMDEGETDVLGLHVLPQGAPNQAPLQQSDRADKRRNQAPHAGRRHLPQ